MRLSLLITVMSAGLVTACASTPSQTSTQPVQEAQADCLQETGSHLPRDAEHPCVNAAGETYTREDINRTGAASTADALRLLSPSVTTSGH